MALHQAYEAEETFDKSPPRPYSRVAKVARLLLSSPHYTEYNLAVESCHNYI